MGLNIKNERVHRLAREAARVTGRTQTGVIEEALVRLLREYDVDPDQARTARSPRVSAPHRRRANGGARHSRVSGNGSRMCSSSSGMR